MPSNLTSISFPASPALNTTYTYGNQTYQWNGTEWVVSYDSNSIPIGAVTLSGNQTITGVKTFSNNIVASGGITGDLTGTIQTAAQPNITSLGTLSSATISGNLTVDTNTLFINSSNDRVGIGTTSPSEKLEVNGTIKATNLVVSGTVVNVVQTALTSNHTISPSGYNNGVWGSNFAEFSTNYRANITPKSSINKILIEVNCHIGTGYWSYGGKVQASTDGGTTWVDIGTAAAFAAGNITPGNYYSAGFGGNYYGGGITQDSYHLCNTSYKFLHSPNTTNNIIYRVVFKGYNTFSLRINRTVYDDIPSSSTDYYPATISTITLTEIAG